MGRRRNGESGDQGAAQEGVTQLGCINRTFSRAEALVTSYGGQAFNWYHLAQALLWADVVIAAWLAHTVIHKEVAEIHAQREGRPLVFVDVAPARDIESDVADFDGVFCYDIDDLRATLDANLAQREAARPTWKWSSPKRNPPSSVARRSPRHPLPWSRCARRCRTSPKPNWRGVCRCCPIERPAKKKSCVARCIASSTKCCTSRRCSSKPPPPSRPRREVRRAMRISLRSDACRERTTIRRQNQRRAVAVAGAATTLPRRRLPRIQP
ncbi:MAG: hypothetical protein R2873_26315 [Caldilineaceae bacterium]